MTEHERLLHEQLDVLRREYEKSAAPIIKQLALIRQYDIRPVLVPKNQVSPEFLKAHGLAEGE